jgi:hypothetical protein
LPALRLSFPLVVNSSKDWAKQLCVGEENERIAEYKKRADTNLFIACDRGEVVERGEEGHLSIFQYPQAAD